MNSAACGKGKSELRLEGIYNEEIEGCGILSWFL